MLCMNLVEVWKCTFEEDRYDEKTKKSTHFKCGVVAEDAHKDMDVETIMGGCDEIPGALGSLDSVKSDLDFNCSRITPQALSINGQGIGNLSTDCLSTFATKRQEIIADAAATKAAAESWFNAKQSLYNDQAKAKCSHR